MQLVSIKAVIGMLWVSTVSVVGIAGNLNSVTSWIVLAIVPPLVVMWRWNDPRQTMSESIQEVLR